MQRWIINTCYIFVTVALNLFTKDNLTDIRVKHSFMAADLYKDSINLAKNAWFFLQLYSWVALTSFMPVTDDGSSNPCYLQIYFKIDYSGYCK